MTNLVTLHKNTPEKQKQILRIGLIANHYGLTFHYGLKGCSTTCMSPECWDVLKSTLDSKYFRITSAEVQIILSW